MFKYSVLVMFMITIVPCIIAPDNDDLNFEGEGPQEASLPIIWETLEALTNLISYGFDATIPWEGGRQLAERTITNIAGTAGYDMLLRIYHRSTQTCAADGGSDTTMGNILREELHIALDALRSYIQANCYSSFVITYGSIIIRYFGYNRNNGGPNPPTSMNVLQIAPIISNSSLGQKNVTFIEPQYTVLCNLALDSHLYSGTVGSVGTVLDSGYELRSYSGEYRFTMETTGTLVFYKNLEVLWSSSTVSFKPLRTILFVNGGLYVYDPSTGAVYWDSHTGCVESGCSKDMVLSINDSGLLMLYNTVTQRTEWAP